MPNLFAGRSRQYDDRHLDNPSGFSKLARRQVHFSDSLAYSEFAGQGVGCQHKRDNQDDNVYAVAIGRKMLPLSGTW